MVSETRGSKFARETWLRRDGLAAAAVWPERGASADGRLRCDTLGCIYRVRGWVVALPRDAKALAEDCRVADVVVSAVPVRGRCPSARLVIDRFDLWRDGAHAVRLGRRSIDWQSVNRLRGDRPWVLRPGKN
jgi:competence protein ComEC